MNVSQIQRNESQKQVITTLRKLINDTENRNVIGSTPTMRNLLNLHIQYTSNM